MCELAFIEYNNRPIRDADSKIVVYLTSSCVNWGFLAWMPKSAKKAQLTHERVEYNVFLFDEPLKGSKCKGCFRCYVITLTILPEILFPQLYI
jgi:hypothetical protein